MWESNFPVLWVLLSTKCWVWGVRHTAIKARDCWFAGKCLFLRRQLRGGRNEPPDAPSLATPHSAYLQLWHYSESDFRTGHGQYDLYIRHSQEQWIQYGHEAEQPAGKGASEHRSACGRSVVYSFLYLNLCSHLIASSYIPIAKRLGISILSYIALT